MNWWSCISKGFWSLHSTQKEGGQQGWQKRYTYHCWIVAELYYFFVLLLLLFVWLHNLNDILFDQPLYLQWYVPLVKPSSFQKTSWLDLFLFTKRKPVSLKRTFNVEYACTIVRWTLRVKKSQNWSVNIQEYVHTFFPTVTVWYLMVSLILV